MSETADPLIRYLRCAVSELPFDLLRSLRAFSLAMARHDRYQIRRCLQIVEAFHQHTRASATLPYVQRQRTSWRCSIAIVVAPATSGDPTSIGVPDDAASADAAYSSDRYAALT